MQEHSVCDVLFPPIRNYVSAISMLNHWHLWDYQCV